MPDSKDYDAFMKMYVKHQMEEDEKRMQCIPGWYNGAYWDWSCGSFRIVETSDSDNTLNYPD